jgi:hypothetical protein
MTRIMPKMTASPMLMSARLATPLSTSITRMAIRSIARAS